MPIFLTQDDVYDLLQREMPEGVYPEGSASASFHGADLGASAKTVETAYSNQARIYANYFPQTADEKLTDFEELHLGEQLLSSLTLAQRRDRVIAKIRQQRRTTPSDIRAAVQTVVDEGVLFEVIEWGCEHGGWVLDESQLDIETILNAFAGLQFGFREDWCSVTATELGLTEEEYLIYREEAYTYEVRFYDYTLTAAEAERLEKVLLDAEPARSRHIVTDGLDSADMIDGDT